MGQRLRHLVLALSAAMLPCAVLMSALAVLVWGGMALYDMACGSTGLEAISPLENVIMASLLAGGLFTAWRSTLRKAQESVTHAHHVISLPQRITTRWGGALTMSDVARSGGELSACEGVGALTMVHRVQEGRGADLVFVMGDVSHDEGTTAARAAEACVPCTEA